LTIRFLRTSIASALLLSVAGQAAAQSRDLPPSTPTGVVADVYSGTAGAISWRRSTDDRGAVRGYEVTRDGRVLDVRDALGYVDFGLSPGTSYVYGVTAIDGAGQRSGQTTVRLLTSGGSAPVATAGVPAPTGLKGTVYSRRNGEIFWTRPATFGLSHEVRRDGRLVDTTTGVGYYDRDLDGQAHTYEIIAKDRNGRRSAPATITLDPGGRDGSTAPTPPTAGTLAAPAGLRGSVYSSRSGEIRWNRSPTFGIRYDVIRDGRPVETTDGLNYLDRDLRGVRHTYEVIAKDRQGNVSAAASIVLDPNGDGAGPVPPTPPTPPTPPGPPGPPGPAPGDLAAPTGLKASVYSSRSGEIAWTRPSTFGLRYDVLRNGTKVTTTDGVGYYDRNLSAGTSYTYQVIAIDRGGRRSAASSIMFDTPDSSGDTGTPPSPVVPPITPPITPPVTPPVTPPITPPVTPPGPAPVASWGPTTSPRDLAVPAGTDTRDGYGDGDIVRFDVETVTTPGTCTIDDQSGCTLADVIADVDGSDDFKVDIPVHFVSPDFPDDGLETNAEMRQRGATSRQSSRKSFRVEFKGKGVKWRNEDKLQINKHPFDPAMIRNKLAYDLMARIPNYPSTNAQFVNLWIDDGEGPVDYGVFTHAEASSEEYFENRGWDEDGKFYKAEKFLFANEDLGYMAIDEDGKPEDKDAFEQRLEIQFKGDNDHRALIEMIEAVNDQDRDFSEVLDRHFDRDNLVTWITVNLLLNHRDATTHNYYLYNPAGTEKFYMLPWDYDQAFGVEPEPENSFEPDALRQRLSYGFGTSRASNLSKALFQQPGFYDAVIAKAASLRSGPFSEATVGALASRYASVVRPVALAGPDRYNYKDEQHRSFARDIGRSLDALRGGMLPFPPTLAEPRVRDGRVEFRWWDGHDITERRTMSYDLEVATAPEFRREDRLFIETGIPDDADYIRFEVPVDRIGSGRRYVRLVMRAAEDPSRIWQIASNRTTIDGVLRFGLLEFSVP